MFRAAGVTSDPEFQATKATSTKKVSAGISRLPVSRSGASRCIGMFSGDGPKTSSLAHCHTYS